MSTSSPVDDNNKNRLRIARSPSFEDEVERWKQRRTTLYTPRTMSELGRASAFVRRVERGVEVFYRCNARLVPVVVTGEGVNAWLRVLDDGARFFLGRLRWRWTELAHVAKFDDVDDGGGDESRIDVRKLGDEDGGEDPATGEKNNSNHRELYFFRMTLSDGSMLELASVSAKTRDVLVEGLGLVADRATELFGGDVVPERIAPLSPDTPSSSRPKLRDALFVAKSPRLQARQLADVMDPRKRRATHSVRFEQDIRTWKSRRTIVEVDASAFTNHDAEIWLPDDTKLGLPHPDVLPGMYVLGAVEAFDETRNEYVLSYEAGPFAVEVASKTKTPKVVVVAQMPRGTKFRRVHRGDMMLDMANQPTTGFVIFAVAAPLAIVAAFAATSGGKALALQLVGGWRSCRDRRSQLVYRFLSYQLVHAGWSHATFNAVATCVLALPTELIHGTRAVFCLYELSVVVAGLAAMLVDPYATVVGASGGVYGLLGVHCGAVFLNWRQLKHGPFNRYVRVVALLAIVAFDVATQTRTQNAAVSTAAHFGGFYAGFLFSFSLLHDLVVQEKRIRHLGFALGLASTLLAVAWLAAHSDPAPFFGQSFLLPARKHRSCCWQAIACGLDHADRRRLDCSVSHRSSRPTSVLWYPGPGITVPSESPSCDTLDDLLSSS